MARDQVSVGGIAVRKWSFVLVAVSLVTLRVQAKVVVFWQPGFPTVASQPIEKAMLDKALKGLQPVFADEAALGASETLANCELLPPYGSAVPVESWKSMERYLDGGGNLLVIGGQPLHVPVSLVNGKFVPANRQDTYARELGFRHTYEVPVTPDAKFQWRSGYTWLPAIAVWAQTWAIRQVCWLPFRSYAGNKTTVLSRVLLPNGGDWKEKQMGKGRILFSARRWN
ncbi:MAG: hypothetical protein ABSF28_03345 [Terracidiphilus sp.]|jgi:hypothetical protein